MARRKKSQADIARDEAMGQAIRGYRGERGLSQEELAESSGLSQFSLNQIETGKAEPLWGTLRALALALEIPLDLLCRKADAMNSSEAIRPPRDLNEV
jgi:transcriptional regulator with XRE-family HTH domain